MPEKSVFCGAQATATRDSVGTVWAGQWSGSKRAAAVGIPIAFDKPETEGQMDEAFDTKIELQAG